MAECVLDASALLAFLRREPGFERVTEALTASVISAVNWAEVIGKASDYGGPMPAISAALKLLPIQVAPFTTDQAEIAGSLRAQTRALGLSLGDRCCLALGIKTGFPVLTTDRSWAQIQDVNVVIIR